VSLKSHTIWLVGMALITALSSVASRASDEGGTVLTPTPRTITLPEQAVECAYEYSGFDELRRVTENSLNEHVDLVTIDSDETPFLRDSIVGKRVWRVRVPNVYLDLARWDKKLVETQKRKSYEVWIDSATGVLYKIFSMPVADDPDLAPEPPSDSATSKLRESGEIFLGFPSSPPLVTFLQALDAAAGSNPLVAKELIAWCVLIHNSDGTVIPVWQIIGRGIPPVEIHPLPSVPMYMRNRMRSIVDARTGDLMEVVSAPPVLRRSNH
jgi:hypothetical protein